MILPVRNATVLAISGGGASEDFDSPEGADSPLWEGRSAATHVEETVTEPVPGSGTSSGIAVDEVIVTRLVFDGSLAAVRVGHEITYEHDGGTHTRKVAAITKPDVLGVVRVTLEAV